MTRTWNPTEPAAPAPAADGVKVGTRFLHSRQIRSVPGVSAKDSPHEECIVTAVRSGRVYFRNPVVTWADHPIFGRAAYKGHIPGWWDGTRFTPMPAGRQYQTRCARWVQVERFASFVAGGGLWSVGR